MEFLYLIPDSPDYVPTTEVRDSALTAFRAMLPRAESVDAVVHREVRFIDSGMGFELVQCPLCRTELDPIWWGDAMNAAERNCFENLSVKLPCCDCPSSLNQLNYTMPAGFARFALQAQEPGLGRQLAADRLRALESILGTSLKQVWVRFKKLEKGQVRVYRATPSRVSSGRR